MQASVHTYDPDTGSGSVLLDTGRLLPFGADAMTGSGLRHLRTGQRVSVTASEEDPETPGTVVTGVWITGIGEGRPIL